jgi:membrane fusion protein (multidrug efflux system)
MRIFAWRLTGGVIVLGCSLLLVIGCGKKETKQVKERIANVRVQAAEKKPLRPFVEAIGNLKADDEVVVSAEVDGVIRSMTADEGDGIARGAMLATIADTDYDLEMKRNEAAVNQAEASRENIRLEYQRKQTLYKEELITKQQFEDVTTRLSLAESQCESAKAGLALAKAKLAKTKVSSPLQGIVKEKKVSTGDYVRSGTPLFTIIHTDVLKLDFTVTEQDAAKIKVGQDVVFRVDSVPEKEYRGRVKTIYPHLDEKTRTLKVEALIPNGDHSLKPGLFARVTLYTGAARETIVVRANAILYDESKTKIFVVEDNLAKGRDVKIGAKYGDMQEILTGVKDKEIVVVVGQSNLAEGVKVNVAR